MTTPRQTATGQYLARYLRRVLDDRIEPVPQADGQPLRPRGAGHLGPSFWADAPWRLEPGMDEIPFTFIVRDGQDQRFLHEITISEAPEAPPAWDQKPWKAVYGFTQGLGMVDRRLWTYRPVPATPLGDPPTLPLSRFATAQRGRPLLLRVAFRGMRRLPDESAEEFEVTKPLRIFLADEPLPLRTSPQWYYGDTHHHSSYTNDIKEFGNPVPDTCAAARSLGLDWLILTDHSVDLADNNPYWETRLSQGSRWDDLGQEVRLCSDNRLRLLRGEEVSVRGVPGIGDNTLHLLVFGSHFERMIPGAFAQTRLLGQIAASLATYSPSLYQHLFGTIHPLEAVLTGINRKGKVIPELRGRAVHAQAALAFAAHPTSFAQAPGGTWKYHDLMQPIHGMEAWNGGLRYLATDEESPFDHWRRGGAWSDSVGKKGIDHWDEILRQRVALDNPRFVLLAGSDAHGSFNFSEGWWVDWDGLRADDNCLGKTRTLLYLPHRSSSGPRVAPTEAEVVDAIRSGSCVVTDGPVVNAALIFAGRRATLGQVLETDGDGEIEVQVQAASTSEFGPVEAVEVRYYFAGMDQPASRLVPFQPGHGERLLNDLPSAPGYVRLATTTTAASPYLHPADGAGTAQDEFHCFTNPIWVRPKGSGQRSLAVKCVDW